MFLAPLVLLLAILAIPLWPAALALLAVAWVIAWPLEALGRALGISILVGAPREIGQ